jgi:hypothetical protein
MLGPGQDVLLHKSVPRGGFSDHKATGELLHLRVGGLWVPRRLRKDIVDKERFSYTSAVPAARWALSLRYEKPDC